VGSGRWSGGRNWRRATATLLLALVVAAGVLASSPWCGVAAAEEERVGTWFTLVDEAGRVLLRTGHVVTVGDRFIDAADREYAVERVVGMLAYCRLTARPPVMSRAMAYLNRAALVVADAAWGATTALGGVLRRPGADAGTSASLFTVAGLQAAAKAGQDGAMPPTTPTRIAAPGTSARGTAAQATARPLIALYHTHSDESYVPTDGTESIEGKGGIFKVGTAMTRALEAVGFQVVHSRQAHDPHDAAAYDRSRGTARQLLQKGPVAIFDIHRDTAPPEAYEARVAGENVDQILIVLGRENPSLKVNEAFAKRLKAAMDQRFPGLVRGLFYGLGKYNQDLSPHALLLEVGSHVTTRTNAERGISLFARGLPPVLGTAKARGTVAGGAGTEARRAASTIGWVLFAVAVGAAVFLAISTGSATEAAERFRRFWRQDVGIRGGTARGEDEDKDEDDGKGPGRRGGR